MNWVDKDTEIYCSFAKTAGNTGCQMMNSAFYYHGLNKIYKSFSVNDIEDAVKSVKTLNIKGFAITMPYKVEVLDYVDEMTDEVRDIGAANTVINDGILKAHNTDYLAAKEVLVDFVGSNLYILGNGGYSRAVQSAAKSLGIEYELITRNNWNLNMKDGVIYNCTPLENLRGHIDESNKLIDCIVSTGTGKRLATIQASHQYKLYTGLVFPYV
jgi:shikimate dehydrogenase|tara:strand:- start:676 stop:1314 length:639 start_codon:yes stop_codon:yes gene_type:complete